MALKGTNNRDLENDLPTSQTIDWSITGNAGTNGATNFIGTTDAQPLVFKVNNFKAGIINGTTGGTFFGFQSGDAGPTGTLNSGYGIYSLKSLTTGSVNSAFGYNSMLNTTTGSWNSAFGDRSLTANVSGQENTAIGFKALNLSTASYNTAVGTSSMMLTTTGNLNAAFGGYSMRQNSTGNQNTAIGYSALRQGTAGSNNTVLGFATGFNVTGSGNVLIGYYTAEQATAISNQLWIANSNTATPLIFGDFATSALKINGTIQITGGTPGVGKVLTSDANGLASWVTPAGGSTYELNLTTNGTSGAATYDAATDTLNIPIYGGGGSTPSFGDTTLVGNTSTVDIIVIGNTVGRGGGTSIYSTAFGFESLLNATGNSNHGMGYQTLKNIGTGGDNIAIGITAMRDAVGRQGNIAIGSYALQSGAGNYSIGIGYQALSGNAGSNNIGIGLNALTSAGSGAIGNVSLGNETLLSNTSGTNNTAIGHNATYNGATYTNTTSLGYQAQPDKSNQIVLGNASVIELRTAAKLKLTAYGGGGVTGTPTFSLATDAAGNIIETALGGGGGTTYTAANGLNLVGSEFRLGGALNTGTTLVGTLSTTYQQFRKETSYNNVYTGVRSPNGTAYIESGAYADNDYSNYLIISNKAVDKETYFYLENGPNFSYMKLDAKHSNASGPNVVGIEYDVTFAGVNKLTLFSNVAGNQLDVTLPSGTATLLGQKYMPLSVNGTFADSQGNISIATGGGDGDKGDITVTGTGTIWTIDNGAVTLEKMANLPPATLIGRNEVGPGGVPEAISIGSGLIISGNVLSAPSGGITTASNGLTIVSTDVKLGGTLTENTIISATTQSLTFDGAGTQQLFNIYNDGTGGAFVSNSNNGVGVTAISGSSTALVANALAGAGMQITGALQSFVIVNDTDVSAISDVLSISHTITGTPANGAGVAIKFMVDRPSGGSSESAATSTIESSWDVISPIESNITKFNITGIDINDVKRNLLTLMGSGKMTLPRYGNNIFTGTATYGLGVDSLGNIVETAMKVIAGGLQEYGDDGLAAIGGIPINGLYRFGSNVKIRVT